MKYLVPLAALLVAVSAVPRRGNDTNPRPVRKLNEDEMDLDIRSIKADDLKFHVGDDDRSVCGGVDNLENIVCYKGDTDDPEVYPRGKAVLRVWNKVAGTLGTAWLIGNEGHILTNWHVIETQAEAEGAEFQAMAESGTCLPKCTTQLGCGGFKINNNKVTFIKTGGSIQQDYTLMKLSAADAAAVANLGYLQLRQTGAVLNERIYIPNHSQGWGKMVDMSTAQGVVDVSSLRVRYDVDTYGGASGSPVLGHSDDYVVAIHNLGGCSSSGGSNSGVSNLAIMSGLSGLLPSSAIASASGPPPPPSSGDICKTVKTVTKAWGYEISWQVGNCQSSGQFTSNNQFSQECCMAAGDWPVTCDDSYGDGWHGGYIEIDGNRYCDDFTTGFEKDGGTVTFSDSNLLCMNVKTVTKAWGYENSWHMGDCRSNQRYSSRQEYTQECCLRQEEMALTCDCSYGDGWHGGYLEVNGNRYCESFLSGYTKEETINWTEIAASP